MRKRHDTRLERLRCILLAALCHTPLRERVWHHVMGHRYVPMRERGEA